MEQRENFRQQTMNIIDNGFSLVSRRRSGSVCPVKDKTWLSTETRKTICLVGEIKLVKVNSCSYAPSDHVKKDKNINRDSSLRWSQSAILLYVPIFRCRRAPNTFICSGFYALYVKSVVDTDVMLLSWAALITPIILTLAMFIPSTDTCAYS